MCPYEPNFIQVVNVSHSFSSVNQNNIYAIDLVDLTIPRRQFISLLGPTGCGKTTLLKIIGGLIIPNSGHVLIADSPPKRACEQGMLGFVFQAPVLFPWRTVAKNIGLPSELFPDKKNLQSINELISLIGLEGFENNLPKELSSGMQSRVALARALSYMPEILLMDEPFASLDESTRDHLNLKLLDLHSRFGLSVVFVTHSVTEAVFLSDRIVVLSPRPAKIIGDLEIRFNMPRDFALRTCPIFHNMVEKVRFFLD